MKTIKLSRDEELALREVIQIARNCPWVPEGQKHLESVLEKIQRAPDDTIMYMEIVKKEKPPTDEELEEMGFEECPQCEEIAWDGRICHVCGAKNI